jgi:integrase
MPSKKHANDEGTIRKHADSTWEARVSLPNGKRKSFYGKTRSEVHRKLTVAKGALDRGIPVLADERQIVGQYLTVWLADTQSQIRPSSFRRYSDYVYNSPWSETGYPAADARDQRFSDLMTCHRPR